MTYRANIITGAQCFAETRFWAFLLFGDLVLATMSSSLDCIQLESPTTSLFKLGKTTSHDKNELELLYKAMVGFRRINVPIRRHDRTTWTDSKARKAVHSHRDENVLEQLKGSMYTTEPYSMFRLYSFCGRVLSKILSWDAVLYHWSDEGALTNFNLKNRNRYSLRGITGAEKTLGAFRPPNDNLFTTRLEQCKRRVSWAHHYRQNQS